MEKINSKNMLFFILVFVFVGNVFAAADVKKRESLEKSEKKKYTEEEFSAAVNSRVLEKLKKLKKTSVINLSNELLKKEDELRLKEFDVKKREEQLDINKKEFHKKILVFQKQQKKFIGCLDDADQKVSKRISHMVDVVAGMRPATAAEVLSVQDADISVRILALLAPQKVSKIFNKMDKEISARLQKQFMTMQK